MLMPAKAGAQINTEQVLNIGRNALYFEDYVLSIQYFNQVIKAKPYLAEPYFYRAVAKIRVPSKIATRRSKSIRSLWMPIRCAALPARR